MWEGKSLHNFGQITYLVDFSGENKLSSTENTLLHILRQNYWLFAEFNTVGKTILNILACANVTAHLLLYFFPSCTSLYISLHFRIQNVKLNEHIFILFYFCQNQFTVLLIIHSYITAVARKPCPFFGMFTFFFLLQK